MNEALKERIVETLKTIHDPEISVNIYDLGLIYGINLDENNNVSIDMTLTSPACPVGALLVKQVKRTISKLEGTGDVEVNLVFEPPWDQNAMSEEARLELGVL
jgi:FeS assembly SUF system protein